MKASNTIENIRWFGSAGLNGSAGLDCGSFVFMGWAGLGWLGSAGLGWVGSAGLGCWLGWAVEGFHGSNSKLIKK